MKVYHCRVCVLWCCITGIVVLKCCYRRVLIILVREYMVYLCTLVYLLRELFCCIINTFTKVQIIEKSGPILTTNLAECVCVCVSAKCDPFLPLRSHFFFKLPEFFFRIAKFPYAAFGPLFAFHCPIFFTINNTLNGVCMLNVTAAH